MIAGTSVRQRVKRVLDVALCLVSLPITLPVMALLAIVVKAGGPGPILYRAQRIGRDMVAFDLLKFRTMTPCAAGPGITTAADPRITPVGRWLRASKLDELPQILNVLRGEMSLVGPRPEDPRFVALYTGAQRRVLTVRPGMTSLAFLHFGHEQAFIERSAPVDVERFYLTEVLPVKLDIELRYVSEWTLLGDFRILARTIAGLTPRRVEMIMKRSADHVRNGLVMADPHQDPTIARSADVARSARIGPGTRIWQLAQIEEGATLGRSCIVGRGAYVGPRVNIGDNVKIQNYALVYAPAALESGVFVGPAAVLTNDSHPRSVDLDGRPKTATGWEPVGVQVKEGASLGARCVCVAPLTIGRWAMVGAGAVVVADVPDFALVVGVPARQIGWVGRAGFALRRDGDATWRCERTDERFCEQEGRLHEIIH